MQESYLYVLSKDDELYSFLPIVLSKLDTNVEFCTSIDSLFKLCENEVPNILLIDDDGFSKEQIFNILENYLTYYKQNITNILLITDLLVSEQTRNTQLYVDYILNGIDYFLSRPVKMMEIVARVSAIVQQQRRLQKIMSYDRNVVTIDVMENISSYLSNHIQDPIQTFINANVEQASTEELKKYVKVARNQAGKVMAAISAVQDEVNKLMERHGEFSNSAQELDDLFQKNLSIISAAYNLDEENADKPKEE